MTIGELDPKLRSLLDAEANRPPRDLAAVRDRVWRGVQGRLADVDPDGSDDPEGGDGPDDGGPLDADTVESAPEVADESVLEALGSIVDVLWRPALTVARWVPWATGASGLVVGVGAGVVVATRAPTPEDAQPPPPVAIEAWEPIVEPQHAVVPLPEPKSTTVPATRLPGERAVIDRARVALRRGEAQEALVALMGHARRFPEGQLVEERDRLIIESLAALGRVDEARARAEAFRDAYPRSIHLPALAPWLP